VSPDEGSLSTWDAKDGCVRNRAIVQEISKIEGSLGTKNGGMSMRRIGYSVLFSPPKSVVEQMTFRVELILERKLANYIPLQQLCKIQSTYL
jgi:hypothetical protein